MRVSIATRVHTATSWLHWSVWSVQLARGFQAQGPLPVRSVYQGSTPISSGCTSVEIVPLVASSPKWHEPLVVLRVLLERSPPVGLLSAANVMETPSRRILEWKLASYVEEARWLWPPETSARVCKVGVCSRCFFVEISGVIGGMLYRFLRSNRYGFKHHRMHFMSYRCVVPLVLVAMNH